MQTELKPRAPRAGATTGRPDDRVAVVTGGATGIGLTTVRPAAAEPSGGTIRRGPSPRTVLAVAALGGAVAYIDATIVNIAFPDIARSFPGTSLSALSWVLNAYNMAAGGPVPPVLGHYPELHGCDLVAYDAAPGALEGWAAALDPAGSHLIREAELGADIARMARRLSGNSVGIVLSGGGARAFAHIGVLQELIAAGARIDRVAGVSMGAVIGALFAMGHDADEIDAICFEEWVRRRPLSDFAVPRHSLIRGNRFRSMLDRTFGTTLIEELPRSFMCGSTELRSGRLEIARYGPLWEAVGFSINLPVIGPPQVRGRQMFIDGSLVDNLPVKALADMGEGPVIAVDVKAAFERSKNGQAAVRAPGAQTPRPPSLGETLTRVLLLGSENTAEAARRHADLLIKPRAEGVGLLEFHQLDTAREAGRAAAREALERAPAGLIA